MPKGIITYGCMRMDMKDNGFHLNSFIILDITGYRIHKIHKKKCIFMAIDSFSAAWSLLQMKSIDEYF